MKQIDLTIGDKVINIKDGELRKGVIKKFYPIDPPIFVIEFEDGSVEKILTTDLAPAPKTPEEENKPIEKSDITITPDEFKKIAYNVIADIAKETNDFELVLTVTSVWAKLYKALFVEPWEND